MATRIPTSNLLATTALATAPAALAFAVLTLTGALPTGQALLAALGVGLALLVLVRAYLRSLLSGLAYVERLARTGEAAPPDLGRAATTTGLGPAVARLGRQIKQRRALVQARV